MNKIYTLLLFLASFNSLLAQSKFLGIVTSQKQPLANVEVINITQKIAVTTNDRGEFQIQAMVNDEITFYLKEYNQWFVKIKMKHLTIHNNIDLVKRPIELGEIKIVKASKVYVINDYESLKNVAVEKEARQPKVTGVYTGDIPNGVDFIAVGSKIVNVIGKIFNHDATAKKQKPKQSFRKSIEENFDYHYLLEKLMLQEDEYELFLKFCETDKQALELINKNKLELFQYLVQKREEFKPK